MLGTQDCEPHVTRIPANIPTGTDFTLLELLGFGYDLLETKLTAG